MAIRRVRNKNITGSRTCIHDLPHPITSDILSRLPINAIAHSMCVCKTWCNLVLDSHFAKLHLSRSSKSVSLLFPYPSDFSSGRNRIFMVDEQIKKGRFYFQKSILGKFNIHNFPLQILDVVCSSNGLLLCLCRTEDTVYICNPIKRSGWVVLPRPNIQSLPIDSKFASYGFGFCHISNQFKVIRIITTGVSGPSNGYLSVHCEMIVLGSNQWRCIGNTPFNQYCPDLGVDQTAAPWVPLNGSLHVILRSKVYAYRDQFVICRFKIYEEELEVLAPLPPCYSSFSCFSLGALQDRLILFDFSDYYSQMNIWVMCDYGVKESWTKRLVIEGCTFKGLRNPSWLTPMEFTEEGELLMSYACQHFGNRSGLVSYSKKNRKIRKHKMSSIEYYSRIDYEPSFLSPSDFVSERNNNRVDDEPSPSVLASN